MNIFRTFRSLGNALRLTFMVLIFSTLFIGAFMYLLGWSFPHALFMGIISSGTTTVVVGYLLPRLSVPESIMETLILESILNDVTLVTASVILLQIIQLETVDTYVIVAGLVTPTTIALLLGVVSMVIWVSILWRFYRGEKLIYVFTLGVLFILYSLVEAIGGNGAIATLVFSLTLGNLPAIIDTIQQELIIRKKVMSNYQLETFDYLRDRFIDVINEIKKTEINFSFFIKNFFFVYLGIIFDLRKTTLIILGICLGILSLMFASRYLSVRILARFKPEFKPYSPILTAMVARGFTATFVAILPSIRGIEIPQLKEMVLIMVLFSTIATNVASTVYERSKLAKKTTS